jgi:A/G-specific adenine glycosylase
VNKTESDKELLREVNSRKRSIRKHLLRWANSNLRTFPWRQHVSAYRVLVAEVLLKRTTSTAVERLFTSFIQEYPDVNALSKAEKGNLEEKLKTLGYHKKRAEIFIEMANCIVKKHSGKIPEMREELLNIPHIGDYTANAILSLAYGIPSAMVDCNIIRIIKRLFLNHLQERTRQKTIQKIADLLSPKKDNNRYNYALLDHGALVCRSGIPRCKICPINEFCDYYLSDKPHGQ